MADLMTLDIFTSSLASLHLTFTGVSEPDVQLYSEQDIYKWELVHAFAQSSLKGPKIWAFMKW